MNTCRFGAGRLGPDARRPRGRRAYGRCGGARNLTGTWSGNLDWGNAGTPPTLNISRSKATSRFDQRPRQVRRDMAGDLSRSRNTILVQFTRTSGTGCDSRNKWRVSFPSKNGLHGAGVENPQPVCRPHPRRQLLYQPLLTVLTHRTGAKSPERR